MAYVSYVARKLSPENFDLREELRSYMASKASDVAATYDDALASRRGPQDSSERRFATHMLTGLSFYARKWAAKQRRDASEQCGRHKLSLIPGADAAQNGRVRAIQVREKRRPQAWQERRRREAQEQVDAIMNLLPRGWSDIALSRLRDGLTYEQIGEDYGVSRNTARRYVETAMELLERARQKDEQVPESVATALRSACAELGVEVRP